MLYPLVLGQSQSRVASRQVHVKERESGAAEDVVCQTVVCRRCGLKGH